MSRRRHVKPIRQTVEFVGFPKIIEGEDYAMIIILLFVITIGILIFTFPQYVFAGLSFDFFLLVVWQMYSGVALKIGLRERKVLATHTKEAGPSLFYRNLGFWLVAGLIALLIFLTIYFIKM